MKNGSGPAAVNGDEIQKMPLSHIVRWEGLESRKIREPENLPDAVRGMGAW